LGEFLVLMEGLDAIVFTGGIGLHDADLRSEVLSSLQFLRLELDHEKNQAHDEKISTAQSAISVLVLETNEELVVARETVAVIRDLR
jgi:acetate kinase